MIKPLYDRVIIEPIPDDVITKSGIYIPVTAREKPVKGRVIATGDGKKDEPLTVKPDDTVIYGKYSGTEISYDGKEYLLMKEADIYAVI